MANILKTEKKVAVISMLCEGSSIRAIERITGIHGDTIGRLALRVGDACKKIMDDKMRNLTCKQIEVDEIWGFIGAKQKNAKRAGAYGDVWTFIALDADTKLIPSFIVGKRDSYHAKAFMSDLASRVVNRVQISSDSLRAYEDAIESGKEVTSPPLPPLRTGRESFPSSGSSRCKAPYEWSRLHDGLIPASWRWMPNFLWNARSAK